MALGGRAETEEARADEEEEEEVAAGVPIGAGVFSTSASNRVCEGVAVVLGVLGVSDRVNPGPTEKGKKNERREREKRDR